MNYLGNFSKIPQYQQLLYAFLAVAVVFGAGYTANNIQTQQVQHVEETPVAVYDQFSHQAKENVAPMMLKVLENPTEDRLRNAHNAFILTYKPWGKDEVGANSDLYFQYIGACEAVVDGIRAGESFKELKIKVDKMNSLYSQLVPN